MGNKQSRSYKLPTFQSQNWHVVKLAHQPRRQYGYYHLYRNNLTNEQIEEYTLGFHNKIQYKKYLEFFQWRQREDTIVNAKFINVEENHQFCNATHSALVYVEHIPIRLRNIQDIPYPESLYVLFSALDGFQKVFTFVGYFQPLEDLVCIDRDGKVKVWFNTDLSRCHTIESASAEEMQNQNNSPFYEEKMVDEIIQMIERNTSEEIEASMTFTQHLQRTYKGKKVNFRQAKQEIINYAKQNQTHIPNYFQSIMMLIQQQPQSQMDQLSVRQQQITDRVRQEEEKIFAQNRQIMLSDQRRNNYKDNGRQQVMAAQQSVVVASLPHQADIPKTQHRVHIPQRPETNMVSKGFVQRPQQTQSTIVGRPLSPLQPNSNQRIIGTSNSNMNIKFNYQPTPAQTAKFIHLAQNKPTSKETVPMFKPQSPNPTSPIFQLPSNNDVFLDFKHFDLTSNVKQTESDRIYVPKNQVEKHQVRDQVHHEGKKDKLFYSDSSLTYELDQEITNDILKYFGTQKL